MSKTTTYVLVGGGILVVAYVLFSKSNPLRIGAAPAATTGTAGIIEASGRAATGFSNLWDSIVGTSSKSGDDTVTLDYAG